MSIINRLFACFVKKTLVLQFYRVTKNQQWDVEFFFIEQNLDLDENLSISSILQLFTKLHGLEKVKKLSHCLPMIERVGDVFWGRVKILTQTM